MSSPAPVDEPAEKPLRRDAERNRQRILLAAREVFAERGLGVSLDDIARHAGLGVGTVYRRFRDKEQLIDALFAERIDAVRDLARAALDIEDPWDGFVALLEGSTELQVADRGLKELLLSSDHGRGRVREARERIVPLAAAVMQRAQVAGVLRPDLCTQDIPLLHMLVGAAADAGRSVDPELWRRYLALLLDGLRADAAAAGDGLPVAALEEEALQAVLRRPRVGQGASGHGH